MAHAHWMEQGREDVDDIYDYIARRERRPLTADRVVEELNSACVKYGELYASGSAIGTPRPDLGPDYRVFTH